MSICRGTNGDCRFRWEATAVFSFIFCSCRSNSVKFQVRTAVLMKTGLLWGVTKLSGKEVLTFLEDVMIHLDGYAVQERDPIFGDGALRNVGIRLSESGLCITLVVLCSVIWGWLGHFLFVYTAVLCGGVQRNSIQRLVTGAVLVQLTVHPWPVVLCNKIMLLLCCVAVWVLQYLTVCLSYKRKWTAVHIFGTAERAVEVLQYTVVW